MGNNKRKLVWIYFIALFAILRFYTAGQSPSDTTPPITIKSFGGPFYENAEGEWIGNNSVIWLNATDDKSGVNYTHYEIWWDSDNDGIIDCLK